MARKKIDYSGWSKDDLVKEITRIKETTYGLVWHRDVPQEKIDVLINPDARTPEEVFSNEVGGKPFPVLKEVKSNKIITDDSLPTNILIEGDNYHSLAVLNFTHQEKIDCIYIDPPYNRGKNDFVYTDKFESGYVKEDDPFRHSKWLAFMEKRMKLAKNLLKPEGVIFISIDDNEQAPLKMLCDEIFGEDNFISMFIHKNNSSKNQANLVSVSTEYMLAYKKSSDAFLGKKWRIEKKGASDINQLYAKLKKKGLSIEEIAGEIKELYSRPKYSHLSRWNKVDEKGVFVDADLSREGGSKDYTITNPDTGEECLIPSRGWGKSHQELIRLQDEDLIYYGESDTPPRMKVYIQEEDNEMVPDSFLYYDNSVDTRMIKEMFGRLAFENPKPIEMIKTIIRMSCPSDALILDFFAGSGTTGHAVLNLNHEDGGSRKFILCTNNENDISSEVCYPRVKKVIKGYTNSKKDNIDGVGGNLRYFTAYDFVESEPTDKNIRKLVKKSSEMLCIKEGVYDLVTETEEYRIFKNPQDKYLGVIFYEDAIPEFKKELKKIKHKVHTYVFSLGDDPYRAEFADMKDRVVLQPIPEVILRVYREIFK